MNIIKEVDARYIEPHAERPRTVFKTFAGLKTGESYMLILDHDPAHLSDIMANLFPQQHTWDYHESGPELFRVEIGRKKEGPETKNIDHFVKSNF